MTSIQVIDKGEGEIHLTHYYKQVHGKMFGDYLIDAWHFDKDFCQLCLNYMTANCNNAECS